MASGAPKFKIREGEVETVIEVKPRHILRSTREDQMEEFKNLPAAESGYRLAWMASGTELEFEPWIDSLDELEPLMDDDEDKDGEDGASLPPTSSASPSSSSVEA